MLSYCRKEKGTGGPVCLGSKVSKVYKGYSDRLARDSASSESEHSRKEACRPRPSAAAKS
eukprot:6192932-Pleurochrysis_carterae.AAC.2